MRVPPIINIDNGPTWVQYVTALGAVLASGVAAWAAFSARNAAKATQRLVKVETDRDARQQDEALWRHARTVTVNLIGQAWTMEPGRVAQELHAVIGNGSDRPITMVRLKLMAGNHTWGPCIIGTIPPWQSAELTARIVTEVQEPDLLAVVRFLDIERRAWVADARGNLSPDTTPVEKWIADGRDFALKELPPEERGTITGGTRPPDFDAWRLGRTGQGAEPWVPPQEPD